MWRNAILMIILSIVIVMLLHEFEIVVQFIYFSMHEISKVTSVIFSNKQISTISAKMVLLILSPAIVGVIIGGIYYGIRKKKLPGLTYIVWIVWIILATLLAVNPPKLG